MRLSILMGSVAAVALMGPAYALPDRYEQGYSCTGLTGVQCQQQQSRLEDGNRGFEKSHRGFEKSGTNVGPSGSSGVDANRSLAARGVTAGATDENELGDEIGDTAEEAGDTVSHTANEAGDAISHVAGEAGDAIGDAADEAGDAISDAFD